MQENKELSVEEKARLMRNQYAREWRRKNPEKVKATMTKHYAKKYDEMLDQLVEGSEVQDGNSKSV